ncbi:MAG: DUF6691 family protein [Candidatus Thermoplasmatota archaeon]
MFKSIHSRKKLQKVIGLLIGISFGFLLNIGGVTEYNVILNQLLLRDFTVLKIMLTAVLVGMIIVYSTRRLGFAKLHPKPCYTRSIVVGGLVFGVGFAILGFCPGTAAGAVGSGSVDALFGVIGFLIGSGVFAKFYPGIKRVFMKKGLGRITIPEFLDVKPGYIIFFFCVLISLFLYFLETNGF